MAEFDKRSKEFKRGMLSKSEREYINRVRETKSVEEMSAHLRRKNVQIQEYLDKSFDDQMKPVGQGYGIEDRPEWKILADRYEYEELRYIKYRYNQLMTQFGWDDVLPTEEMQILQLVELEITSNQSMSERKMLIQQQRSVQRKLEHIYEVEANTTKARTPQQNKERAELEARYAELATQLTKLGARQQALNMQKNKLLETLKGTREQRVKVIEGSKASFLGHLKALTDADFRRDTGEDIELMRIAMEKEKKRLSKPHKYVDDMTDQPLLTPETVLDSYDE